MGCVVSIVFCVILDSTSFACGVLSLCQNFLLNYYFPVELIFICEALTFVALFTDCGGNRSTWK